MAITNRDGIVAGVNSPIRIVKALTGTLVAGQPRFLNFLAGYPGAGSLGTPGIGGQQVTSFTGQIPFTNPVSGNTQLTAFGAQATQAGLLELIDLLWYNSGLDPTLTSEQTFTSAPSIPSRDADGAASGREVMAGLLVTSAVGAGTPTITHKYTNSVGTTGQTGTNLVATTASAAAGSLFPLGLAAGDNGIRTPQSLTLSATWTSGSISYILYRSLGFVPLSAANVPGMMDYLMLGFPRLFNNTTPALVFTPNTTTTSNITSWLTYAQG